MAAPQPPQQQQPQYQQQQPQLIKNVQPLQPQPQVYTQSCRMLQNNMFHRLDRHLLKWVKGSFGGLLELIFGNYLIFQELIFRTNL